MTEFVLEVGEGHTLHAYDTGAYDAEGRLAVFWHHGTPNVGAPPEPLFAAAARLGIRSVSYDRPGYGGSTHHRDVTSAAAYASSVADALGIDRFAAMGATPAAVRTPLPAVRCCRSASLGSSRLGWPRSVLRG